MNYKIWIILAAFFATNVNAFAVPPQKRTFENILVESGTSTKNIMPLLANITGRQRNYINYIYGQYRANYIIIRVHSNGKIDSAEKGKEIAEKIASNVLGAYPSSEGRLKVVGTREDVWDSIEIKFKDRRIIKKETVPSKEAINGRIELREQGPAFKFGLTEEQRKHFSYELEKIADRAYEESMAKYPSGEEKSIKYEDMIYDKYERNLLERYGITKEQAKEIDTEMYMKGYYRKF